MIIGNPITLGGGSKPKKLLSSLTEGSLVSVLEDGKLVPFYVAKHDYEADLNGGGRTLLVRKEAHSAKQWSSARTNSYANSTVDVWLNGDYADCLSNNVKAAIGLTSFYYTIGGGNTTLSTLQRGVFLLSLSEYGKNNVYANTEGSTLPIASALLPCYKDGTAVNNWVRTCQTNSTEAVFLLNASSAVSNGGVDNSYYARPCFTLPANMALRETPYEDGSWGLIDEWEPTDTVDITDNGIHDVKEYSFANVNVAPVLLWTNASPTSTYSNQEVSLPAGYSVYLVEIKFGTNTNTFRTAYVAADGYQHMLLCPKAEASVNSTGSGGRIVKGANGLITFGHGYSANTNTSFSQSDANGIPTRIWGVKFTL